MSDRFIVNTADIMVLDADEDWDEFVKASFGGDRSAAGRYAANIRWQKQGKGGGGGGGGGGGPVGDAMRLLSSKGATVKVRGQITEAEAKLLRQEVKEWEKTLDKAAKKMLPDRAFRVMPRFYEATRLARMAIDAARATKKPTGNPLLNKPELIEMRDAKGQLIALGAVSTTKEAGSLPDGKNGNAMFIDYLVSFGQVKKAGMALYGEMVKHGASRGAQMAGLEATALSEGFWKKMGYVPTPLISGGAGFMYLPDDLRVLAKELP